MTSATGKETGQLRELLDRERALRLLRSSGLDADDVRVTYVRIKPGLNAIVGYALLTRDDQGWPREVLGYARTFADGSAPLVAAKWARKRVRPTLVGDGVRLLAGHRSIFCLFPNDAELGHLGRVGTRKLSRVIGAMDVLPKGDHVRGRAAVRTLRYKPERRWVGQAELNVDGARGRRRVDVVVRLFREAKATAVADLIRRLRGAGLRDVVPRPLGVTLDDRLYVEAAVAGEALLPRILRGEAPAASIAEALRRLHAVPPAGAAVVRPEDCVEGAARSAALLADADESLREPARRALSILEGLHPRGDVVGTLHGDFHLGQVLLGRSGPVLVDFERSSAGDPLLDVGSLAARILAETARHPSARSRLLPFLGRFVEAYGAETSRRPADIAFHVVHGLIEAALSSWRSQEPDWPECAAAVLGFAERVAAGEIVGMPRPGPWERLHPKHAGPWPGWTEDATPGLYDPEAGTFQAVDATCDERLPGLRRWLNRGDLVAYRPGRRAVVRVDDGSRGIYAKVLTTRRYRRLSERHRRLEEAVARANYDFVLPELLGAEAGVLVFAAAGGHSLHATLREGGGARELEVVARGIASLHAVPPDSIGLEPRPGDDARAWLDTVARADRHAARRYEPVARTLEEPPPAPPPTLRTLHGDLHDKNLHVDGTRLFLLDLDGMRAGDPAEDVGNLVAHLLLRSLQTGDAAAAAYGRARHFTEAYGEAAGAVDLAAVRAWTARALFRLACLYRFRRPWQRVAEDVLAEVARWVD